MKDDLDTRYMQHNENSVNAYTNRGRTVNLIHKENPTDAIVYQNFISYLYEAQHVSGDTPPIIRSLKLH